MAPGVYITGLGVISAAGADVAQSVHSLRQGTRNFTRNLPFDSSLKNVVAFRAAGAMPDIAGPAGASRSVLLAAKATREALENTGIERLAESTRLGVCIGTTVASQLNNFAFYKAYRETGQPPLDAVNEYLSANLARVVGDLVGPAGPRLTVVNACSSGTDAIGIAAQWIRAGLCDIAIAGGADELNRVALAGFWSLGVMSAEPCQPFDGKRAGLNLGEGAGMLVLESAAHAAARGVRPAFELAGYGAACDAHHLTAPHPDGRGLATAMQRAMEQAEIGAERVAFTNAHGTATQDNDRVEGRTLRRVLGEGLKMVSTKGYTGHTLGAAGGIEAVFTILGLREGWIPQSAGFQCTDPEIGASPVSELTAIRGDYAASTSLAFGGNNAALIVRRIA